MSDQASPRYQPRTSSLVYPQSSPYDSPVTPRSTGSNANPHASGSGGTNTQSPGLMQSPSRRRPPPALDLDRERQRQYAGPSFVGPSFGRSPSMPLNGLARLQLPPGAGQPTSKPTSSHVPHVSISNSSDGRVSLDSYYLAASPSFYQTQHTTPAPAPAPLLIPQTPDPPDPYLLDRGGLIGVGELSTPRWTSTTGYRHMRTPSQPMPIRSGSIGLGIRQDSSQSQMVSTSTSTSSFATHLTAASSPKAMARSAPDPAPKMQAPSIGSLGSFGDVDFMTGMQDALASVSVTPATTTPSNNISSPTPPLPRVPSKSPRHTHRTPPPHEENVVYVPPSRRSKHSPPNSADSAKRKSEIKTTPGSPHHEVLKHFAAKDFSHLPPSPSSASINQFLRGSGSIGNFASVGSGASVNSAGSPSHAPQGQAASVNSYPFPSSSRPQPSAPALRGASSVSHLRQEMDPETAEALRKLDGLGARSKSKEKVASLSRPVTPPPPPPSSSVPPATAPSSAEKRTSSSTATTSSQSTNPTTPSFGVPSRRRGSDTSSIVSDLAASIGEKEKEGTRIVPPVPPLPKDFQALRASLAQPPSIGTLPGTAVANSVDLPRPQDSAETSPVSTTSKRPMNKKWSFSSALNLNCNSHSQSTPLTSPEAPLSPQAWTHVDLPPSREQIKERPAPVRTETGSSTSSAYTLAPSKLSPGSSANNKRLTPSSIPFFRRSSSSIAGSKLSTPTNGTSAPPVAPGEITPAARKSVLGIGIPSMLKGSNSRRNLSAQLDASALIESPLKSAPLEDPKKSGMGWTGRRRGKTLSNAAADAPSKTASMPPPAGPMQSHASSRLRASLSVAPDGTMPRPGLPSITASPTKAPSLATARPSETYRGLPSTTPTKIPRITSRTVASSPSLRGSMLPPAVPSYAARGATVGAHAHRTVTGASHLAAADAVNEFGVVSGSTGLASQTTTRLRPAQTPPRESGQYQPESGTVTPRRSSAQVQAPPSRRALPQPPSSTASASSSTLATKKLSRELPTSRRSSLAPAESGGETSPVRPPRSVHAKLSIPSSSRISTSTSTPMFDTPSSSVRQSIISRSPSSSPFEDEESLGDSEMAAYVKRRKARKPSSSKPDDLTDLLDFPDPIPPTPATSPRNFIQKQFAALSDYERQEILDFSEIYYWGAKSEKNAARSDVTQNNYGYDDERGDYLIVPHDHLAYRYEVIGVLGKGSFGQVIQCRDHKTGESVAVKIIRNKKRFHHQALVEVKILKQLVEWDPEDKHYLIRMTENFYFRGHLCIVTELLSINLYELIKANNFVGFSTVLIRRFTTQMLASLQLMRTHRIVHCDLKPENILLRHPAKSGIKVIDFGSSCLETEKVYTYIQSRFYRSPEVILGMNYHMAIDMWSLGCILAELYTGFPIFPGENENEQLACIMEVMGVPDRYLLDRATRKKQFFDATGAPRPFVNAKGKRRRPGTKTLGQVLKSDDDLFVDFIGKCLAWDPERRLKPQAAMRHPWILAGRRRQQVAASSSSMASSPASTPRKMMLISGPAPLGSARTPASASKVSSRLARNPYQSMAGL